MFHRKTSDVKLGDDSHRYTTILETPECFPDTITAKVLLFDLLGRIVSQPDLIDCNGNTPQKLEINHTGGKWVATASVVVHGVVANEKQ